jgi:hypothetical protein
MIEDVNKSYKTKASWKKVIQETYDIFHHRAYSGKADKRFDRNMLQ